MGIQSDLTRLSTAKSDIIDAITAKGVTVPTGSKLDDLAALIDEITGGGQQPFEAPQNDVNFYDCDGVRVYSYTIAEAQALSALPEQPVHDGLTGQGWNHTLSEVTSATNPIDAGAIYVPDDGRTRLHIAVENTLYAAPSIFFTQTVSEGVVIDWGDGSATETVTGAGSVSASHTYTENGEYTLTLHCSDGTMGIGWPPAAGNGVFGWEQGHSNQLRSAEIGANVTSIYDYAFYACRWMQNVSIPLNTTLGKGVFCDCTSMQYISVPPGITVIPDSAFSECYALRGVSMPSGIVNISKSSFGSCRTIKRLTIPLNTATIGNYVFRNCASLQSITIPMNVTAIGSTCFQGCEDIKAYHIQAATPPALADGYVFVSISDDCKIYVPAASLSAYQSAANWSEYASYMAGE